MSQTLQGSATHLPRHKLDMYRELSERLDKVHRDSKRDMYSQQLKQGVGNCKTAECFAYLREMKKQEGAALKTLEKYLKKHTALHPTHHHREDLDQLAQLLKHYQQKGGWF
jgi:hypothetical protein